MSTQYNVCFVLETIRTSAMREIHIIVKTEETQRLRIVFVLYCSTWIQTQTKSTIPSVNRSTNLASGRHLNLGLKTWGLLCRTQGSSTSHLYVHNTMCFDVSSILFACTKQDVVHPDQFHLDLYVPCSLDPQTWRIQSVFCSNFVLLVSILNWWWNANWLHLRHDKCSRRSRSVLKHFPVMKDQWDCVLNDLAELGDK